MSTTKNKAFPSNGLAGTAQTSMAHVLSDGQCVRAVRAVHAAQYMAPGAGQGIVAHRRGLQNPIQSIRSAVRSSIRCWSAARHDLVPAAAAGAAAAAAVLHALGGLRAAEPRTRQRAQGRRVVRFRSVRPRAASCDPGGAELPSSERLRRSRKDGATWQTTCLQARRSCQTTGRQDTNAKQTA